MNVKPNGAALCRLIGSPASGALVAALLVGAPLRPAVAQEVNVPPADAPLLFVPIQWQEIDVLATPYIWLPWISSTVRPSNGAIPSKSSTTDPGTLYGHVTWVPFTGSAEFRDGSYGLLLDYIHLPLKTGVNTRDIFFSGATAGLTVNIGTAMFLYRPVVEPDQYVDIGIGVRGWGIAGDITLNEGLLPAFNASRGLSWADPLIGARYHRDLGNGFGATAYGDIGGFGAGAHIDWQLVGTIDYAVNSAFELHGGVRSLNFNYGGARAEFNANINGPILSATFRI
ncbi:MAG TPA: hypothetical protein VIX14_01460 [Terriglobales bacterium]